MLPVGISFYTFQTMSYVIDAWRGDLKPTRRLVDFVAYVSFFPQLVAGPIERATALLPQFRKARRFDGARAQSGAFLFLWGLYKKTVIADNVGKFADAAFGADAASPAFLALGVVSFSIQIFCDFSGYSDMARGLARILGFDLMVNFSLPYFSRTPSEFWRRWHISLSSWLRDYLYVPLGGNRRGGILTYRNLFLTMLLGGLWHGAAWTFIVWGAFHGIILVIYRLARIDSALQRLSPRRAGGLMAHGAALLVMMALTLVGWTFFRAETIGDATHIIAAVSQAALAGGLFAEIAKLPEWPQFLYFTGPLLVAQCARRIAPGVLDDIADFAYAPRPFARFARLNAGLALLLLVVVLPAEGQQSFIYFDF
jgi:D-alanyl-lipoteichoic acid acyltransferase DltB (MBOAT superfamily)